MSNTPNLFDFATSELSQDAVLAYLFAWADENYKKENEQLHSLGRGLIAEMAIAAKDEQDSTEVATTEELKALIDLSAYDRVLVKRQLDKIDIVVFLDPVFESEGDERSKVKSAKAALLIEDKVFTSEHSGQLKKYLSGFNYGVPKDSVYPLFYKTGLQAGYASERAAGFAEYSRETMVNLLEENNLAVESDTILHQYRSYLQGLTDKYAAGRKSVPVGVAKENWFAWQGFMHELGGKLTAFEKLHWQYVPNAQGGFFGMWWGFTKIEQATGFTHSGEEEYKRIDVYLQLEEDTLTLRAGSWEGEKISSEMRKAIHGFMALKLKEPLERQDYTIVPSGRPGRSCRLFKVLAKGAETTFATGIPIEDVAKELISITKAFDEVMRQKQAANK